MTTDNFIESEYLAANPDVAHAIEAKQFRNGREHYDAFGRQEGRMLNLFNKMTREKKALYCLDKKGFGLEIGPSHNPIAPKNQGFNVHILDHLDTDALRKKYADHGVKIENIEKVDFVWHGQALPELIGDSTCYDWIIASHVVEHIPDLITFLQQCETLLKPEGKLSLIIPDKRYCFDYFNAPSSTGEFLDALNHHYTRPTPGKVFDHFSNASKRDGNIAWSASHGGRIELVHTAEMAKKLWQQSCNSTDYLDVHCWRFTPDSFRLIWQDFKMLGLLDMNIIQEFPTTGCEFYVTLGKGNNTSHHQDRLSLLKKVK